MEESLKPRNFWNNYRDERKKRKILWRAIKLRECVYVGGCKTDLRGTFREGKPRKSDIMKAKKFSPVSVFSGD